MNVLTIEILSVLKNAILQVFLFSTNMILKVMRSNRYFLLYKKETKKSHLSITVHIGTFFHEKILFGKFFGFNNVCTTFKNIAPVCWY